MPFFVKGYLISFLHFDCWEGRVCALRFWMVPRGRRAVL